MHEAEEPMRILPRPLVQSFGWLANFMTTMHVFYKQRPFKNDFLKEQSHDHT